MSDEKRRTHCPFCDATAAQVAASIKRYGLWARKFCDYCGIKEPPEDTK